MLTIYKMLKGIDEMDRENLLIERKLNKGITCRTKFQQHVRKYSYSVSQSMYYIELTMSEHIKTSRTIEDLGLDLTPCRHSQV